jgi:hypothetical protein
LSRLDDYYLLLRRLLCWLLRSCWLLCLRWWRRRGLDLHFLLRCALERTGVHRALAHRLKRRHYVLRLIEVGLAERRRPGETLAHGRQHRGKLAQRFDAGIPRLRVDLGRQRFTGQAGILFHEAIGFHNLRWVG